MKIVDDIFSFLFSLDTKKFTIYLVITISSIFLSAILLLYLFNRHSNNLLSHIKTMQKLAQESREIIFTYETIQERKKAIFESIEKDKNFDLKSFFASFCKENNLKPDSTWTTIETPIEGNELLEETSLALTFANLTMQQVVAFIDALEKKERVYVKTMNLTKEQEPPKLLTCSLTIATLKYRSEQGE